MPNNNLAQAKAAKNDEFYTRYKDIETEVAAYTDYNPDVFRGKVILLPCDDPNQSNPNQSNPAQSNFSRYFADNFERFGLKKLVSTCLAVEGDFRCAAVTAYRDEADFIITNPPFSLFREFMAWTVAGGKQFLVIGGKNAITYKDIFPLIKANKMWVGATSFNKDMLFLSPGGIDPTQKPSTATRIVDGTAYLRAPTAWFTNIDHGRRHQPLTLMSMADNLRYNKKMQRREKYARYDNYDALEVPATDAIPNDYAGLMGVPISFLDKYSPEQFEILGASDNGAIDDIYKKTPGLTKEFVQDYYKAGGTGTYKSGNPTAGCYIDNVATMKYKRIFIKHKVFRTQDIQNTRHIEHKTYRTYSVAGTGPATRGL